MGRAVVLMLCFRCVAHVGVHPLWRQKKIVKKACMYTFLWRYFIGIRQVGVSLQVEIVHMYHFS